MPESPGLGVTLDRDELDRLKRLELPPQAKWIIRSRFENGARMYNIADPEDSIFMVRPDRRRGMVPMRYDAPITTEYWDDDGSDAYREMFARIEREERRAREVTMRKPKLIHYNDARHYSIYRYEPPMSLHQWRQPVDEILGTEVDTLVYGLGSGETFLHGTKAGLKWGEGVEEHNMSMMWWWATKNLNLALEAGIDPLAVAVERAHGEGPAHPGKPADDRAHLTRRRQPLHAGPTEADASRGHDR